MCVHFIPLHLISMLKSHGIVVHLVFTARFRTCVILIVRILKSSWRFHSGFAYICQGRRLSSSWWEWDMGDSVWYYDAHILHIWVHRFWALLCSTLNSFFFLFLGYATTPCFQQTTLSVNPLETLIFVYPGQWLFLRVQMELIGKWVRNNYKCCYV